MENLWYVYLWLEPISTQIRNKHFNNLICYIRISCHWTKTLNSIFFLLFFIDFYSSLSLSSSVNYKHLKHCDSVEEKQQIYQKNTMNFFVYMKFTRRVHKHEQSIAIESKRSEGKRACHECHETIIKKAVRFYFRSFQKNQNEILKSSINNHAAHAYSQRRSKS